MPLCREKTFGSKTLNTTIKWQIKTNGSSRRGNRTNQLAHSGKFYFGANGHVRYENVR